jgi:hypothetical protein
MVVARRHKGLGRFHPVRLLPVLSTSRVLCNGHAANPQEGTVLLERDICEEVRIMTLQDKL